MQRGCYPSARLTCCLPIPGRPWPKQQFLVLVQVAVQDCPGLLGAKQQAAGQLLLLEQRLGRSAGRTTRPCRRHLSPDTAAYAKAFLGQLQASTLGTATD